MISIRPRRSVLSMPGANARALEKAKALPADCLILDLEDSVAPEMKAVAREQAAAAVESRGYGYRELLVRINALDTPWGRDDLAAAARARADGILIPKVQSPQDIADVRAALAAEAAPDVPLWAMIETPLAVLGVGEIAAAAASERYPLAALIIGPNDLAKETRVPLTIDRAGLLPWLSICVLAARAHGIGIIDGVFNDISDEASFHWQCAQGRGLGMDGKMLIHPSQIAPCNAAFAPAETEIVWAKRIVEAFDLPENRGRGAISLDGKMVELLHAEMARRTVAMAAAIAAREAAG